MSKITILDGGMGKELRRIGAPFRQPEWSALALLEAPEFVSEAHRNFVAAGAEVIITNTYSLVPFHIGEERFAARAAELTKLAGELARSVADAADRPVTVAGSLPPLFGSYEPEKFRPDAAPAMWRTLIEAQAPYVDLWVGETISSIDEAVVLMETLATFGQDKSVWLAFTLADHLSAGAPILRSGEAVSSIADLERDVEAVLFNCSQPEVITPAVVEFATKLKSGTRLGAYANAFPVQQIGQDGYSANEVIVERRPDLTADRYRELAVGWVDAGASIVGGCCDIYPEHVAALAEAFDDYQADG